MPKKEQKAKKQKQEEKSKERWSSWFLKGITISGFFYVVYWSFTTFAEYHCLKCVLPTLGISGMVSAVIVAILNEAKHLIIK